MSCALRHGDRRNGFTLVEVVVSSAVAGMLLFGLASAVVLVGRAMPDESGLPARVASSSELVDAITRDIQYATEVVERSGKVIEVVVPDRDADGQPETIRYEWSGKPGTGVTWTYNGRSVELAPPVERLAFSHHVESITTREERTTVITGTETLLASFYDWGGTSATSYSYRLSTSRWVAATTLLTGMPTGTTSVRFTRARFRMHECSILTRMQVELSEVAGIQDALPAFLAVGSPVIVAPGYIGSSYGWVTTLFADAATSAPDRVISLVVKADGTMPEVQYYYATSAPADGKALFFTVNSGGAWSPPPAQIDRYGLPFELYGVCTTETTASEDVTRHYLNSVGIAVRSDAGEASDVTARVTLLNAPEVAVP